MMTYKVTIVIEEFDDEDTKPAVVQEFESFETHCAEEAQQILGELASRLDDILGRYVESYSDLYDKENCR